MSTMREEFEVWWTEPAPQTGNSYQDVYGDASGIVRLAFAAGQRAEREACARTAEWTPSVYIAAAIRARDKEQGC